MKISRFLIPLTLALTAIALADDLADFKKWYTKEAPKMQKAMESKDLGFLERTSTKDFTYKAFGQPATPKKQALEGMKQQWAMTDKIKYKYKIVGFKKVGNAMTVDMVNDFHMTTKPGPDKKVHTMSMVGPARETWVKVNGKWLLKGIVETKQGKMLMDGKPMAGMPG
jgi:hypothetical protein